jgi:uncharacterized membrane protein
MDSDSVANATAAGMFGIIMVVVVVACALTVFFAWLFWRVFAKTGMNGALGLLCLVPSVGPLICLLILAFSRWPIEDVLAAHGGFIPPPGGMVPPSPPPPAAPPGSSVMPT